MTRTAPNDTPIATPIIDAQQWEDWFPVTDECEVAHYLSRHLWPGDSPSPRWRAARLSNATYLYRETTTGWTIFAKFYTAKVGDRAVKYATREHTVTLQARTAGLSSGAIRAVQPLGCYRGVLFLEYCDGLTIEDCIAVRRSRPGIVLTALADAARLLALLHSHSHSHQQDGSPSADDSLNELNKIIDTLDRHGVLKDEPLIIRGLHTAKERWAASDRLNSFVSAAIHGDATTSNFIIPWTGGLIGIDWERFNSGDQARDVGRLMAEASHSITRHGGTQHEALACIDLIEQTYHAAIPDALSGNRLGERIRFQQALSTLRIARNGWLPRLERITLIARAMVLLAD